MGVNTYKDLTNKKMIKVFDELFELKTKKTELDKRIKELEKEYKPSLENRNEDLYYKLPNGIKFSIKTSIRKGGYDSGKIDTLLESIGEQEEQFKKPDSVVKTLRIDK